MFFTSPHLLRPDCSPGAPVAKLPRLLVWFRRDLRVEDNPALAAALELAEEVIPVYIYAPEEEGQFQPGRCSRWWLNSSLHSLDADLQALGSRLLCLRAAESRTALASLARDLGAQGVVFNHLYDPISMVRDNEVKATMAALGLFCRSFNGDVLREPWEVVDDSGKPFTNFDAFWAAHCASEAAKPMAAPIPAPTALPPVPSSLAGFGCGDELGIMTPEEELSNSQLEYHWTPGCAGARRLLKDFIDGRLRVFDSDRSKTDRNSTSRLSPHIHFGEVSARSVAAAAAAQGSALGLSASAAVADFLKQLGYREYSRYLSFHFPFTHERSLLEHLRAVPWRMDQSLFKAWRTGTTGHPLVDAGMREVWSTGWMHNRLRVVCASFLVKHLLLPWQWGLKHYWDALLDADLECDALGWQYCAGCLTDGHDFSKLIDLATEAKRYDPKGNYVRRWLPVLARLPAAYIHTPWAAPPEILADAGVELGVNYPWPVIEDGEAAAALAAAADVVHTAAITAATTTGTSPGVGVVNGTTPTKMAVDNDKVVGVDILVGDGPFLPPTLHDPSAADKVWGGIEGALAAGAAAGGTLGYTNNNNNNEEGAYPRQGLSLNSTDEALSEEVQSNTFGIDASSCGRAMMRTNSWASLRAVEKKEEKERRAAAAAADGAEAGAVSFLDTGRCHNQKGTADHAENGTAEMVLHDDCRGDERMPQINTSGGNTGTGTSTGGGGSGSGGGMLQLLPQVGPSRCAGGSGGSNPATNTIAVVPTLSEAPSAAKVPEVAPELLLTNNKQIGAGKGLGLGVHNTVLGARRVHPSGLPLSAPSLDDQGVHMFDSVNGVAVVQGGAVSVDEEHIWPPEKKQKRPVK